MRNKLPKLISFLTIATIASLLFSPQTNAQETVRTITISPPSTTVNLNPGEKTEGTLKVINNGDAPLTFSVQIRDFIVTDSKGTPQMIGDNDPKDDRYTASSWLGVYPSTFTIQPHEKQELNYYIQVPRNANPGGHYAAVVYTPDLKTGEDQTGASINSQMGTLFLIGVNGQITENALVSFFSAPFKEFGPVNILTQIKNLGDLHIRPTGNIIVSDLLGRKTTVTLKEQNIFPGGGTRDYENTVGQKFMIGPYKAKLTAAYGRSNDKMLVTDVTFWVFPWRITLVLVLIIIAIVLFVKLWKKRKINKQPAVEPAADETSN